jgi:hypothetical protein
MFWEECAMNKPRRTQKQKRSSQTIHPFFRSELLSLMTTSTGKKRRLLLAGLIAAMCVVTPEASVVRNSYLQFRPLSIRLVIRTRKITPLAARQQAQTASTVALPISHTSLHAWQHFAWHWQTLSAFIDLSQTTRGSPAFAG